MVLVKAKRDELLVPLAAVSGIIERRHTLPILSNVLIERVPGALSFLATDIEIQAKEILRMKTYLNNILVENTTQPLKTIEKDTDRDFFMSAREAKDYGLIDEVIVFKEPESKKKPSAKP